MSILEGGPVRGKKDRERKITMIERGYLEKDRMNKPGLMEGYQIMIT